MRSVSLISYNLLQNNYINYITFIKKYQVIRDQRYIVSIVNTHSRASLQNETKLWQKC